MTWHVESDFNYKGFRCVVVFQTSGFRCGYVGISQGHKLFGIDYDEANLDVHGGLTYGEGNRHDYPVESDLYWLGFDCGHAYDKKDLDYALEVFKNDENACRMLQYSKELDLQFPIMGEEIRTQEYVEEQCKYMVDQIVEEYTA